MNIKRSTIGLFCQDIIRVNHLYDELKYEKNEYESYDGGQQPFEHTELYTETMSEINEIERKIGKLIKYESQPTIYGGPVSKIKRK